MKKIFQVSAFLFGILLFSAGANAAYVQLVSNPQVNDGLIDLPPTGFTATYSPTAGVNSIFFNSSVSPQNPGSVAASITDQFGGALTLVGQNDNFSSGSISLNSPFNLLAVHLGGKGGGNELLFFFNAPVTSFTVMTFSQGGSNNLSNFRAYNTDDTIPLPDPIPLPAAAWLFGSALLGLAGVARRKKSA